MIHAGSVLSNNFVWDWRSPILKYLTTGTLPDDTNEARRIKARAARFYEDEGVLYKKSFTGPMLRCLGPQEALAALREIHVGECGDHSGVRRLIRKILRTGYFWPTLT